ncbi:hypothetical protein H3T50_01015 [Commensalibacter sp. M0134]|uniref:hypothetical protein n=1 Tax=Commensalibacter melissae TaxID=2070537 RepID=UPI0018DDDD0C|nr:hypothetical protein [Commensalibacter melissae]MBI0065252.1 hypothetical protein [Commensalibacter sp. M0134]MBI0069135.1 hypothetical protein [Commensalibacter sp. M0133]MBI0081263.1 hypothetical protein [Commensalibacter melissae]
MAGEAGGCKGTFSSGSLKTGLGGGELGIDGMAACVCFGFDCEILAGFVGCFVCLEIEVAFLFFVDFGWIFFAGPRLFKAELLTLTWAKIMLFQEENNTVENMVK